MSKKAIDMLSCNATVETNISTNISVGKNNISEVIKYTRKKNGDWIVKDTTAPT